jgi:glucose/mannose-6-phosphate isomerase
MRDYVLGTSGQIENALKIVDSTVFYPAKNQINNIVICGLGGSGIAGQIIAKLMESKVNKPVTVINDYDIPFFANQNTLVIVSSYSGNTEEISSCILQAQEKKCEIACISSGGEVAQIATINKYNWIKVPSGFPPRTCFAYSLIAQHALFQHYGLINDSWKKEAQETVDYLNAHLEDIQLEAKRLADKLTNKIAVVYSSSKYNGVAVRFCQQIAENAKQLCWSNKFPEMNHNEIVGWTSKNENLSVVFLHFKNDHERVSKRMDLTKDVVKQYASDVQSISSKGNSELQEVLYMVYLTDWVSVFIAENRKVDPLEIKAIDNLKNELSQII